MIYRNKLTHYIIQFDQLIEYNEIDLLRILKEGIDNGPLTLFNMISNDKLNKLTGISYSNKTMAKFPIIEIAIEGFLAALDSNKELYMAISSIDETEKEFTINDYIKKDKKMKSNEKNKILTKLMNRNSNL